MSEEQLFKCAAENTRRLFPPVVRSMNDIMKEMFARDGMPQEIADMMIAEIPPEQTMWVISNERVSMVQHPCFMRMSFMSWQRV